jgi:hypothetical protein
MNMAEGSTKRRSSWCSLKRSRARYLVTSSVQGGREDTHWAKGGGSNVLEPKRDERVVEPLAGLKQCHVGLVECCVPIRYHHLIFSHFDFCLFCVLCFVEIK